MNSRRTPRLALLSAAFVLVPTLAQAQPADDLECGCGKAHALWLRAQAGLPIDDGPGPGYSEREALTDTDVLSNAVDLELLPANNSIQGSNTMTVRSLVNGLTQFSFSLRSNFTVQANLSGNTADNNIVILNGSTRAACSTPPGNNSSYQRRVTLDRAYNAGETFTVQVFYFGVPPTNVGFGSFAFTTQGGATLVSTLSEPYYAATWLAAKDGDVRLAGDNADKATWTIAITAPDTLSTTANGVLQGIDTLSGSRKRYRWATNYPMSTYLACFSTTNYNAWSRTYNYPLPGGGTGSMPVLFNIYPNSDTPANRAAWEKCLDMLAAYRPFYGEYPFVNEKYGIYQFPFGGGMEHQTNTGQGTFDEGVTAHELGHQWWGDNVTCKTWGDIWLNEGFATYTEALWYETRPGSTGLPAYLSAMVARKPSAVNDSVYVYDVTNLNRIFSSTFTYRKGAWVLHQLRHLVGDATFYQILAAYRQAYQGSAATTAQFAAVASSIAGTDLSWFFEQWVMGVGAPEYQVGSQAVTINGQRYLRLSIAQTQDATWPGAGAPAGYFRMPLDVRIATTAGDTTRVVQNSARTQWYVLPVAADVTGVTLDPDNWVLNTGKTSVAYVPGPAKVVEASPAPGAALTVPPATIRLSFSEDVSIPAGAVTLTGPGGPVAGTLAYTAGSFTATFTPSATLAPGQYTLAAAGTIASVAGGAALDGEYAGFLPTGDGLPGGAASWSFTVVPACDTDFNQDGNADQDDVAYLINVVSGGPNPTGLDPDFNQDGNADQDDIAALIGVIAGGPCP
jgi:methionine-rich copper-binding protein CopC